jgi:hypothetical protein
MSTTATIAPHLRTADDAGYRFGLAGLVFLWALATGLMLFMLVVTFVPGHTGMGELLQRIADAAPSGPQAWTGSAP